MIAEDHKTITLVAAMGRNHAIGLDGRIPWHLPAELQHFKQTTMGKTIVMGRKTWQAIGRPLPGRQNVVVSRDGKFKAEGAAVVGSLAEAVAIAVSNEVMVIGGGQLYALALPAAQRMVLTLVDIEPVADTWFPEWHAGHWQQVRQQHFPKSTDNEHEYTIVELRRVSSRT